MGTHHYAIDGDGNIHVFHSQNERTNWLGEVRPQDRRARSIEHRDAEKTMGRATLRKMTKDHHPPHFLLEEIPPFTSDQA